MTNKILSILYEAITRQVDPKLKRYINNKIVPMYKKHDRAHDKDHAKEVIESSFLIARLVKEDIDPNILITSAALHDVGLRVNREEHHIHSARIIRKLKTLKKWFNDEEIETIAQVAEDHRASLQKPPRSIYGKIISDADKSSLIKIERAMERTWLYRIDNMKNESDEEIFNEMYNHLNEKFGSKAGYAKLYLKETMIVYKKDIARTRKICDNKDLAFKLFQKMRKDGRLKR